MARVFLLAIYIFSLYLVPRREPRHRVDHVLAALCLANCYP